MTLTTRTPKTLMVAALVFAGVACKATPRPVATTSTAPAPTPASLPADPAPAPVAAQAAPPVVIGMQDPFARMNGKSYRALKAGWRALGKRRYDEARTAFHTVVAAQPDHTDARFLELKAAALAGDFAAVPALWRELLARDFVSHARRLDSAQELAPLRASKQWPELVAIRAELETRYDKGLDQGLVFVARTHLRAGPQFAEGSNRAKLDLDQEVYHLDPTSGRIRRLTDTGGRVVAIHRDGDHKHLLLVMADALQRIDNGLVFSKPEVALLSLESLERWGPKPLDGEASAVELCFSDDGEPVWSVSPPVVGDPRAFTFDATASNLVNIEASCSGAVATTVVRPDGIQHHRPTPEGLALSDDGLALSGVDGERPMRASQAIRPGSIDWSPGKRRLVYTSAFDRCQENPADLVVWDSEGKQARRLKAAVVPHETRWLDDDHLVYQSGMDRAPTLTIQDLSRGGARVTVKAPAGAGLYGITPVPCVSAEAHAMSDVGPSAH
jgi:hypothetical protein